MTCKQSEKCDHADICRYAKSDAYNILGGSCYRPKEPLTNEEYLRSCNTEQLAEVFFEYRYINATPRQQLWLSANEDFVKGGIVEWLKQPHKE